MGSEPDATDLSIAALSGLQKSYAAIGEMIDGYRASLLTRGYSASAAEQMTVDFHRGIIPLVFKVAANVASSVPPG